MDSRREREKSEEKRNEKEISTKLTQRSVYAKVRYMSRRCASKEFV